MPDQDVPNFILHAQDLLSRDRNIRCLPLSPTNRLVHVDSRIGKRIALALGSGTEEKGAHAGSQAHADGGDIAAHELHGIVDSQASTDNAARTVYVEADILIRVFTLEVKKLSNDQVGDLVVDRCAQENNALLQEERKYVKGTFPPGSALYHHGNNVLRFHLHFSFSL